MTKIISWNVNGIRAIIRKKKLQELINNENPDILCLNEIKINEPIKNEVIDKKFKYAYWNFPKHKKGYSGTAIFTNVEPISVKKSPFDDEGRLIHLEFSKYNLINVYTPNSKPKLTRLEYRINDWDTKLRKYIKKLDKPVILTCDMNVAHEDIDIHNPKGSKLRAGWSDEERNSFSRLLKDNNLIDTFRNKHPKTVKYTYWDYKTKSRERNKGWRIDCFLVSQKFYKYIKDSNILSDYFGSDHVPIILKMSV